MLISLDYDDTYTEDPDLWLTFVKHAQARNHTVILCTMRYPEEGHDIDPRLLAIIDQVVYTRRQQKKQYLRNIGLSPHVWIDDSPHFITDAYPLVYQ